MKSKSHGMQLYKVLGIFALCIVSFGAGYWIKEITRSTDEKLIDTAYLRISSDSLFNQQSSRELSYAAIRGMLSKIDDPYAELVEPQAAQNFSSRLEQEPMWRWSPRTSL